MAEAFGSFVNWAEQEVLTAGCDSIADAFRFDKGTGQVGQGPEGVAASQAGQASGECRSPPA